MRAFKFYSILALTAFAGTRGTEVTAQPVVLPVPPVQYCNGPLGPGPCHEIRDWMRVQQQAQMSGLPGAGMLPRDGYIVLTIAQNCRGMPQCMAVSWGAVEIQRCRGGIGQPGGCMGPNGEIIRAMNRVLPQHLRTDVLMRNVQNDLRNGPSSSNDVVGCDGWLAKRIGWNC